MKKATVIGGFLIAAITILATIVGLLADFKDLTGGDEDSDTEKPIIVESFSTSLAPNNRKITGTVTIHNQGDAAYQNGTITFRVESDAMPADVQSQPIQSILEGNSLSFNFETDISAYSADGVTFNVLAEVEIGGESAKSDTRTLTIGK